MFRVKHYTAIAVRYIFLLIHVVGTHLKCLCEALVMSTHNILGEVNEKYE